METQSITKKCPSCKADVSLNITKCPYCGRALKSWFGQHPILTVFLVIFGFFFVIAPMLGGSGKSNPSSGTEVKQPAVVEEIVDKTSLEYKIRHKKSSEEERFIVDGMEIRIGESADSVFQKLPKNLIVGTKQIQDKEYGLVVEHNYGKYSILLARNVPVGDAEGSWYIVYDIYPSDYTP